MPRKTGGKSHHRPVPVQGEERRRGEAHLPPYAKIHAKEYQLYLPSKGSSVIAQTPSSMPSRRVQVLVMATHADMTTVEFEQIVRDWIAAARHPKTGKLFTEMTYQPMLEVLAYLRANGFKNFIVSGGGIECDSLRYIKRRSELIIQFNLDRVGSFICPPGFLRSPVEPTDWRRRAMAKYENASMNWGAWDVGWYQAF